MGGGSDPKSSTTFQLAPEQRDILKIAMPFLQDVKRNPPQPPSGTAIAPFNPTQETAQAGALAMTPVLGDYAANAWDGNQFLSGGGVLGTTPFNSQFNKVSTGQMGAANPTFGAVSPIAQGKTQNPVLDMLGMFTSGDLMDVNKNPSLRGAIDAATRPIVENTLRQALPAVRQDFIGAGQYGGTKQGLAESQAINEMQKNVGDVSSSMANRAYETGLEGTLKGLGLYSDAWGQGIQDRLGAAGLLDTAYGRQMSGVLDANNMRADAYGNELDAMLKGLGLAPQTASLGLLPWQVMSAVGDTQQGMDMARQQEAYQQKELANMWNLMLGQELAGTVGLIPGGTNISKTSSPEMNPLGMALGGLGLVSGLGPLLGLF